jgi:hypothetical protein
MSRDIHKMDFGCPIHKLAKSVMLRCRHLTTGYKEIDINRLRNDARFLRTEIGKLEYNILEQREDLVFYLLNATQRLDRVNDDTLRRELSLAHIMVSTAVKRRKAFDSHRTAFGKQDRKT